jgi:hypothetical protein
MRTGKLNRHGQPITRFRLRREWIPSLPATVGLCWTVHTDLTELPGSLFHCTCIMLHCRMF